MSRSSGRARGRAQARNQPRRGPVSGDWSGPSRSQHGAPKSETTEAGDLAAREFGVPQADIPGGRQHWRSPETVAAEPAVKPERPADYHKYHGVASDDGLYETPPKRRGVSKIPAEPEYESAVPVYVVPGPGKREKAGSAPRSIDVPIAAVQGGVPVRVFSENEDRTRALLLNESATIIRIGQTETDAADGGAALPASMTVYLALTTQDSLYAIADSGSSLLKLSVIEEFAAQGRE